MQLIGRLLDVLGVLPYFLGLVRDTLDFLSDLCRLLRLLVIGDMLLVLCGALLESSYMVPVLGLECVEGLLVILDLVFSVDHPLVVRVSLECLIDVLDLLVDLLQMGSDLILLFSLLNQNVVVLDRVFVFLLRLGQLFLILLELKDPCD